MPPKPKMVALQKEVTGAASRWGRAISVIKGAEGPFPLKITRQIEKPRTLEAEPYVLDTLGIQLVIDSLKRDSCPVHVRVTTSQIPLLLANSMATAIECQWKEGLRRTPAAEGWLIERILSWVEVRFHMLLQLVPACLEQYNSTGPGGLSERRYAIVTPAVTTTLDQAQQKALEEKEKKERAEAATFYAEKAEREATKRQQEKDADAAEKKREHELGLDMPRMATVSKKEREAAYAEKHDKQGKRLRKQGPRKHKYEGPASDAEKAKENKKKKEDDKVRHKKEKEEKREKEAAADAKKKK